MNSKETIYEHYGVPTVVNGAGMKTRIGGTLMREEAVEAMVEAAEAFARVSDRQAAASDLIAEATGAEAGYVASGAAACLTLTAAASMAGSDPGAMSALPRTEEVSNEIVMARTHRTGYDHAFRTAGATIVDVGTNDRHLGTGSQDVERWEIADAIGENTAAVGYIEKPYVARPRERRRGRPQPRRPRHRRRRRGVAADDEPLAVYRGRRGHGRL